MPDVNHSYLNECKALETISKNLDNPTITNANVAENGTDIQLSFVYWDRVDSSLFLFTPLQVVAMWSGCTHVIYCDPNLSTLVTSPT